MDMRDLQEIPEQDRVYFLLREINELKARMEDMENSLIDEGALR